MSQSVQETGELAPSPGQKEALAPRGVALPWVSTWIILLSVSAEVAAMAVVSAGGTRGFFLTVIAGMVCLLAALFDGWTGRIPNPLTYPAILLGLLANALPPLLDAMGGHAASVWLGAAGWQASVLGFLVCAGLGILGCLVAGVHGGDVKLLAAIGALLGLTQTANVLIVALAVALVYALLNLILLGGLNAVMRQAAMRGLELVYLRRFATPLSEEGLRRASHIPMAVPLAIGLIVAQCWAIRGGGGLI